jgi:hypothetical protein
MPAHRGLRHRNAQLEQFMGCAPQGIGLAHSPNEITNVSPQLLAFREGGAISWSNASVKRDTS